MVIFRNRTSDSQEPVPFYYPVLDPEAFHDAKLVAPGYVVYYLEQEWQNWWVDSGCRNWNIQAGPLWGLASGGISATPIHEE
jgi:hypothetical protein